MNTSDEPDPYLQAYQNAFRPELETAVRAYELPAGVQVLDCPCGDGFYSRLLARHMTSGTLVAADLSAKCLKRARASLRKSSHGLELKFIKADSYRLPFEDNFFDFAWCAQSFITLDDPVRALQELGRVVRPGGQIAVLETDEYHHVLLPWPITLEQAIQRAVRNESQVRFGTSDKYAQSRRLRAEFLEAGLRPTGKRTVVADRSAPFGKAEREFLTRHFEYLRKFIGMELTPREMAELEAVCDHDSPDGLLNRPDAELTCLSTISHAIKE